MRRYALLSPVFVILFSLPLQTHATAVANLELKNLKFMNSILEGEVINRGTQTADQVWLYVEFRDKDGTVVVTEDFRVIPGGDGKSVAPGWSKHFQYQLKLEGSKELIPVGAFRLIHLLPNQ